MIAKQSAYIPTVYRDVNSALSLAALIAFTTLILMVAP